MTLKSNPLLTIKNMEQWQPLAAVGNSKGMLQVKGFTDESGVRTKRSASNISVRESLLQVVNLAKNEVIGEYLAHTNQIQFIKWIDQKNLITIGESVLHNDQARFSNIRRKRFSVLA